MKLNIILLIVFLILMGFLYSKANYPEQKFLVTYVEYYKFKINGEDGLKVNTLLVHPSSSEVKLSLEELKMFVDWKVVGVTSDDENIIPALCSNNDYSDFESVTLEGIKKPFCKLSFRMARR